MILPPPLLAHLAECLGGTPCDVIRLGPAVARATIGSLRCVVKWAAAGAAEAHRPDPCTAEARGLQLLAAARAVRVPHVYAQAEAAGGCAAFVVTEWIATGAEAKRYAAG